MTSKKSPQKDLQKKRKNSQKRKSAEILREKKIWKCIVCGFEVENGLTEHCQTHCPQCGATQDCSDP